MPKTNEEWQSLIDSSIAYQRLLAYCQPIFEISPTYVPNDAEPALFEVLARLVTETGEVVPAAAFINVATSQQLKKIDRMIIKWALNHQCHNPKIHAVNLSGHTLNDLTFPTWLHNEIKATGADPRLMVFEVTEQVMLEYLPSTKVLAALRDLRFAIGLDDMGIGYAGIQAILAIKPEFVKIDRSLVDQINNSHEHYAIVSAIMQGASEMKIPVILEGIETGALETKALLMAREFPKLRVLTQGYLYSKPELCR